jgi:hypothetical protein
MKRPFSWRRQCYEFSRHFVRKPEFSERRRRLFEQLAGHLIDHLKLTLAENSMEEFVRALPKVLGGCNRNIYDDPGVADAYAFMHLLERYRKTWIVLELLLRNGHLPFRDGRLDVLDVGAGPCASSWAVQDFYSTVQSLASEESIWSSLALSQVHVQIIERSRAMVHFAHCFAERSSRPGPFGAAWTDIEGIDLVSERLDIRKEIMHNLIDEEYLSASEAHLAVESELNWWKHHGKFNLCIFSNFVTETSSARAWGLEIKNILKGMPVGGIAAFIGGIGGPYPEIYEILDGYARAAQLRKLKVRKTIKNTYKEYETEAIKDVYHEIMNTTLTDEERSIARGLLEQPQYLELTDLGHPYSGPKAFGARVYRKDRPFRHRALKRRIPTASDHTQEIETSASS